MTSEQKCQKCGLVGGAVLSWSENGVARSSWCCPRCMSRLLDEREALLEACRVAASDHANSWQTKEAARDAIKKADAP